ncbi:hypothetical protein [Streptomyces sp. H27-D2]|uniref:hypothetical protein n=1 Tax=Streptomyces sp. H27-D2 TaxID=3046304 RepID=UPI002DB7EB11|nr:hypothetical protein [Streptomyces sp. H27-D2]MEC4015368.1 hypothetical protein [Streptomyces sp. H27-D2]
MDSPSPRRLAESAASGDFDLAPPQPWIFTAATPAPHGDIGHGASLQRGDQHVPLLYCGQELSDFLLTIRRLESDYTQHRTPARPVREDGIPDAATAVAALAKPASTSSSRVQVRVM